MPDPLKRERALQYAAARLCSSLELRELALTGPEDAARLLELSPDDLSELNAKISPFAERLVKKRAGDTAKLLPLSSILLGKNYRDLFQKFAAASCTPTTLQPAADACGFLQWLLANGEYAARTARRERKLLQFELRRLQVTSLRDRFALCWVQPGITLTGKSGPEVAAPGLYVWLRMPLTRELRAIHLRIRLSHAKQSGLQWLYTDSQAAKEKQ